MTKHERVNDISKLLEMLPEKDLSELVNDVYNRLTANGAKPSISRAFDRLSLSACAHCGSEHFVKNGKDRNGNSRYICRECGRSFTALTNTVLNGTHKTASVWKLYVKNMLDGLSLAECAKRCGISVPTAFVWRHKILCALSKQSFDHAYSGLMEMDEMFVRISYKGNHTKSKDFVMPRNTHKRGSDGCDPSNKSKVSVLCVVEREKSFSAVVPCRGMINKPLLDGLFNGRLSDESVVMTDGLRAYKQYFGTTNVQHVSLPRLGGNVHKVNVVGPYHINNVNAMHSRLRGFLKKYNGVSTKFLSNYLALFLWMENHKDEDKNTIICDTVSAGGTYVSALQLREWVPAPDFAPPSAA